MRYVRKQNSSKNDKRRQTGDEIHIEDARVATKCGCG